MLLAWEPLFENQCIDNTSNRKGCFLYLPRCGLRNHTNAQFSTNNLMRHHDDEEGGSDSIVPVTIATSVTAVEHLLFTDPYYVTSTLLSASMIII